MVSICLFKLNIYNTNIVKLTNTVYTDKNYNNVGIKRQTFLKLELSTWGYSYGIKLARGKTRTEG